MQEKQQHGNIGNKNAAKDDGKTSVLTIRCTPNDKSRWVKAARPGKLARWVTKTLNAASE